jgi:cytochrome c553
MFTNPAYPVLLGKETAWLVKQLKDFQSSVRRDPAMNAMTPTIIGHEQAIADYLARQ